MNVLCLDLEASGLGPGGFPVEVALAPVELGEPISWLILPAPRWLASGRWDDDAEALHGLSLTRLLTEGISPKIIAEEMNGLLWGAMILSDNPAHDMTWLRTLYQAAGAINPPAL